MCISVLRILMALAAAGTVFTGVLALLSLPKKRHIPVSCQKTMALLAIFLYLIPVAAIQMPEPSAPLSEMQTTDIVSHTIDSSSDIPTEPPQSALPAVPAHEETTTVVSTGLSADAAKIITLIWLIGAGLCFLFHGCSYALFRLRLKNRSEHVGNLLIFRRRSLKIIPLLKTEFAHSPALVGILKPAVLIPPQASTSPSLPSALLHERAHYCAHDIVWRWFALTAQCLHWWNPAAWLAGKILRESSESVCDLSVTASMDLKARKRYLLALLEFASAPGSHMPLSASVGDQRRHLERRFSMVLHAKSLRPAVKRLFLLLTCALLMLSLCLSSTAIRAVSLHTLDISAAVSHPCRGQLSIWVEGDSAYLIDSNGQGVAPLQYNGAVYIPAATAAEWLGKTLHWDEDAQILRLSGHSPAQIRRESAGSRADGQSAKSTVRLLPNCTVTLDGTPLHFVGTDGSEQFPISYNGSIYLPLRSIGTLCGYEVTWYQANSDCAYVFLRTPLNEEQQLSAETYVNAVQQYAARFSAQVSEMVEFLRPLEDNPSLSQEQAQQLEGQIADLLVSLNKLENLASPDLTLLKTCPRTAMLQEDAHQATATLQSARLHLRAGADLDSYLGLLWGDMPDAEGDGIILGMSSYAVLFTTYGNILHRIVFQTD